MAVGPALLHFYGVPDVKELNHMFTRRRNPAGEADKVKAALAEGGVTLSPEVIARLTATLPPSSFFQT